MFWMIGFRLLAEVVAVVHCLLLVGLVIGGGYILSFVVVCLCVCCSGVILWFLFVWPGLRL